MTIVDFTPDIEEIKEELLFRFDFVYPPALIAELLGEYTHKEYWIGKELSDFENGLKDDSERSALKQAVANAEEIGALQQAEKDSIFPHIILWNKTDGTIRSLNEDYSGFIDDPNDFFRFCSTRKDIMAKLTANEVESRVYTHGLSKLKEDTDNYSGNAEENATKYARQLGINRTDWEVALQQAKEKAKMVGHTYMENPDYILGSCIAKALKEEALKVFARTGKKVEFWSGFSSRSNIFYKYHIIRD